MERAGMEWEEIIDTHQVQFVSRACEDTLTGKNLLPLREQILSCMSAIPNKWNKVEEILPACLFHFMF